MKRMIRSMVVLWVVLMIARPVLQGQEVFRLIQEGDTDRFTALLEEQDSLVSLRDPSGNTPLHLTAYFGRTDMMRQLLEKGADVQAVNRLDRNALMFAIARNQLGTAGLLLENGIDVKAADQSGRQALHWCAMQGSPEMCRLILSYGTNVNASDNQLRTPLHHAANMGNTAMAEELIKNDALVNAADYHMRTPLFNASWNGHLDMVKLLIAHKAVVDARYIGAASPLTTASVADNTEVCKYLVSQNADVNLVCNMLVTPIYPAILNNNQELVKLFLEKEAQVNYTDLAGRSPLYVAVRDGYTEIAKMLMDQGADPQFRESVNGRSLLHIAASNGRKDMVEPLLKRGLKINEKDMLGYTALDYARKHSFWQMAGELKARGGKNGVRPENTKVKKLLRDIPHGEAYVTKLRTNTWGVSTHSGMMVFGYTEDGEPVDEASLLNGSLTPEELKEVPIYHFDGAFSGDAVMFQQQDEYEKLELVCNAHYQNRYSRQPWFNPEKMYFPALFEPTVIRDIKVTALPGYTPTQQSYLIQASGLNILWLYWHSDRYKPWENDRRTLEYLKKEGISVDLLFVGVPYSDMGPEWISVMEVEYEMAAELDVRAVFPVPGCKMGEYFALERKRKGDGDDIHYALNPGDVFHYRNGMAIKK